MKSAAAVAHSLGSPFVLEDVELPELQHTDVLVRIVAVGVCHTDIASRDGQLPATFPAIFGHEGAGVVEAVGDQVTKVAAGDHARFSRSNRRDDPWNESTSPGSRRSGRTSHQQEAP